jgi:hypothetical protein
MDNIGRNTHGTTGQKEVQFMFIGSVFKYLRQAKGVCKSSEIIYESQELQPTIMGKSPEVI